MNYRRPSRPTTIPIKKDHGSLRGHVKTRLLRHVRNISLQFSAHVCASCALLIFSSYSSSIVLFFPFFLFEWWLLQFPVGLVLNYLTLCVLWLISPYPHVEWQPNSKTWLQLGLNLLISKKEYKKTMGPNCISICRPTWDHQ